MISIRKMSVEEIKAKPYLLNFIYELFGDVSDSFFEYEYEGETRWFYSSGYAITLLTFDGEYIGHQMVTLDEDYNILYAEYDGFDVWKHKSGNLVVQKENGFVAERFEKKKLDDNARDDNRNGIILYYQYNANTLENMILAYNCVYRGDEAIFPFEIKIPFFVTFFKGKSVKKYVLYETDTDYMSYNIITLREFGLKRFLKEGAYTLQKEDPIKRYFKVWHESNEGNLVLLYPISHIYKLDDIYKLIESKGFMTGPSDEAMSYFNGEFSERKEIEEVVEAIKSYDKSIDEKMKMRGLKSQMS